MASDWNRAILVVEDSDEDFDTFLVAAKAAGLTHQILRATSGDSCLKMLRADAHGTNGRPALVLMDLNTPGTDGRDALQSIKADPLLKQLPVVMFSTSANVRDLEFCYAAGANAYHVKPLKYEDHLHLLHCVLGYWFGSVVLNNQRKVAL